MSWSAEVLFIGGRSGVGKSSVAHEIHAQLSAVQVRHAVNVARSDRAARDLDTLSPPWVHRVPTDDRTVAEVAAGLIRLAGFH